MKFLTQEELSKFYGKPFDEISPTDTPVDKYICGASEMECLECGCVLDVYCEGVSVYEDTVTNSHGSGFVEQAFCASCEIMFSRNRDPVSDEIEYQYHQNRVDEREEYVCSDCKHYHPITVPTGEWEYTDEAVVHSYESISIMCPCGTAIGVNDLAFPIVLDCENCSRKYEFSVCSDEISE